MAIKTLRDAELEIENLKRQNTEIIKQSRYFQDNITNIIKDASAVQGTNTQSAIDSLYNADQNRVIHRLLHQFKNIEAVQFLTSFLDIKNNASAELHISADNTDQGFYITNNISANASYLSHGSMFNGTSWIAKSTASLILQLSNTLGLLLYYNGSLTVGSSFSPTQVFRIAITGSVTLSGALSVTSITTTGDITIGNNCNVTAQVNSNSVSTNQYSVLGTAGIDQRTPSFPRISTITPVSGTIQYKDHAGTNQSLIVVTAVNSTTVFPDFVRGIKIG